ncbi:hypothetical protein RB200_19085 [Streptomyces sp. PmtG]
MRTDTSTDAVPEQHETTVYADTYAYTDSYANGYTGGGQDTGHGRHRGPVAAHDEEGAPRGRHRKQTSGS